MTDSTTHILVVDDDLMARMEAAQCVKHLGFEVTMATGGAQALEMLKTGSFDLILLDLMMPDVDGFDVLRDMPTHDKSPACPVIIVSGTDDTEISRKCIDMGAAAVVSKPLDPKTLADHINAQLANSSREN